MLNNNIFFTVYIPTYNRYKELESAIKSFIDKSFSKCELLISDDLGSDKIEPLVKKYQKLDKRIHYYKNKKNLGFQKNFLNAFNIAKGKYIIFMGDDDLLIDDKVFEYFYQVIKNKNVGVIKARQILFKNNLINQVYPISKDEPSITIYQKGEDTFRHLWTESLSITGLAFLNNTRIKKLASNQESTLYPQVELMGKACLFYNSASINRHLVGVRSHPDNQLNCMIYKLDGKETNLITDWVTIYDRVNIFAQNNRLNFYSKQLFLKQLASFIPLFIPYTTLTNGRIKTINLIKVLLKIYPKIKFQPNFIASLIISTIFPNKLIELIIEYIKRLRLIKILSNDKRKLINKSLYKYKI